MKGNGIRSFVAELARRLWNKRNEISFVTLMSYATFGITFLTQALLARLLEPTNYGIYIGSLAIIALVEVPLVVRGSEVSLRRLGAYWQQGGRNVAGMVKQVNRDDLRLFLIVFVLIVAASGWLSAISGADHLFFIILTLIIPAQIGYGVFRSYFMIFDIVPLMVKFEMTYALSMFALTVAGYSLYGMLGLAWAVVLSMLLKTYLAYLFTKRFLPVSDTSGIPLPEQADHSDSLFSVFRNLCSNGINQIDLVILAAFQVPQTVAIYKVAKSLSALPTKISFPVWRYLQPKLIHAVLNDEKAEMQKLIYYGAAALFLLLTLIFPFVWVTGQELIVLIYGPAYREAFQPLLVLLVGVWAFNGLTGWFKIWAVVSKSQRFALLIYFLMLAALITLGVFFGQGGPLEMAYAVSCIFVVFSILVTIKVLFL
jgi:O-antigen/teichoic acid export membrane protein